MFFFIEEEECKKPLFEIYKWGFRVEVPLSIQRHIRTLADENDICEVLIIALILRESTFRPEAVSRSGARGLGQIKPFWIERAEIDRLVDDVVYRCLFNPYDNITTIFELFNYALNRFPLDLSYELDIIRILYWYNRGRSPMRITHHPFSQDIIGIMQEITVLR